VRSVSHPPAGPQAARHLINLAELEAAYGDPAAAPAASEASMAVIHGLGVRLFEGYAHYCVGFVAHRGGRLEEAEGAYREALVCAREVCSPGLEQGLLTRLGRLAADRGRLAEARALLDEVSPALLGCPRVFDRTLLECQLGVLASLEGDAEEARIRFDAAEGALREIGAVEPLSLVLADRVEAELRLGGEPGPALAEALALADQMGVPPGAWLRRRLED